MSLIYQAPDTIDSIRPGLYIGSKADAKNKDKLSDRKITHILNMTPNKEASIQAGVPNYFEGDFTYKRIPVYDASTSVSDMFEAAEAICAFISSGLCHGSVLIHCQRGVSRSVTAALFYLLRHAGMTLDDATSLVKRRRAQADPIPSFLEVVKLYETECRANGYLKESKKKERRGPMGPTKGPSLPPVKRSAPAGPSLPPKRTKAKQAELCDGMEIPVGEKRNERPKNEKDKRKH